MSILDRLLWLIAKNECGYWVPAYSILEEFGDYGDSLVPDLIRCLSNYDTDIHLMAVQLLFEIRPRPIVAVPAIIEQLDSSDRRVQAEVLGGIAAFGSSAITAIPLLEALLDSSDGYFRVLAAVAIVSLDTTRTDLLPQIKEALKSSNVSVRYAATSFFQSTDSLLPFDEAEFQAVIKRHLHYQSPSNQIDWSSHELECGMIQFDLAPVYQEFFGGEKDGQRVWAGFVFDYFGLSQELGVVFQDFGAESRIVGISGDYFGQRFLLRIHLEPLPESEVREVLDVIRNEVRAIDLR